MVHAPLQAMAQAYTHSRAMAQVYTRQRDMAYAHAVPDPRNTAPGTS